MMKKYFLAAALIAASANASIASADTLTPYVCTPSGQADATATFVVLPGTNGESYDLQLVTAANGNSSTGGVVIDTAKDDVFSTLEFNVKGAISASNGPFVLVYGTQGGQPASLFFPYSKSNVIGSSTKGTAMRFAVSKKSKTQITIQQIVIGFYPNAKETEYVLSNVSLNSAATSAVMSTYSGCPAGTTKP
jgi:hypothetical protein